MDVELRSCRSVCFGKQRTIQVVPRNINVLFLKIL